MKRVFVILTVLVLLAVTSCGSKETGQTTVARGNKEEFNHFLTEIRQQEEPWTEEEIQAFEAYVQPKEYEHMFSEDEIKVLMEKKEVRKTVTSKQAAEDIELAFQLLSYAYGGYQYFGGDEVFLPIRDDILNELKTVSDIKTYDLWKLLWDSLSPVIADDHFYIVTNQRRTWIVDREYLQSTYFVRDLYFDDPAGIDSQYVKRTIGPDGAITYCLAAVVQSPEKLPAKMTIEGVEYDLRWRLAKPISHSDDTYAEVFSETAVADGRLPVIHNYSLSGDDSRMEKFVFTGASYEYKKAPAFVLDLRGNNGGNANHARLWLRYFCDKQVEGKTLSSIKLSNFHTVVYGGVSKDVGSWHYKRSDGIPWDTGNSIFVLIDGNTCSAGEIFANMLTMGKQVVLVGTNTRGCLNFGNINSVYLPNSGIRLQFGSQYSIDQSLEKTEGVGYFPDLWVEPEDSLDAVVRLCNYYGLLEEESK